MEVVDRVQELVARVESLDDPVARETAQELLDALLELYGDGLERIVAALDEAGDAGDALRATLAEDGVVASLLLIHGLYPVPLADAGARRRSSAVRPYMESHGGDVELLGPRGRRGPPAPARQLRRLPVVGVDAGARDQAGARGDRARPARDRGRGRRGARRRRFRGGAAAARRSRRARLDGASTSSSRRADSRQPARPWTARRLLVANVGGTLLAYRNACAGCGAPLARRRARGRRPHLPRVLAALRAAARRPARRRDRAAPARRRCRSCVEDGEVKVGARAVNPTSRLASSASCAGCAAAQHRGAPRASRPERCDLCGARRSRRPPPPAPPRGAAHRLHVRDLPRAAPGRQPVPADRHADVLAAGSRAAGRALGPLRDPDRSRLLLPRSTAAASSRSTRARPGRPSPSSTSTPGRSWSPRTRCSQELEPDVEALIVEPPRRAAAARDRPDRRVLPAGRPDPAGWQGISGGPTVEAAVDALLRRARAKARRPSEQLETARSGGTAAVPEPDLDVVGARAASHAAAPTLVFSLRVREPRSARSTRSRSRRRMHIDPAGRGVRRGDTRGAGRSLRRGRALGGDDAALVWAQVDRARAELHRRGRRSTLPCRAPTTSRWPPPKYFDSLPGRRRPARLPLHRHDLLPRRATAGCSSCRCRGPARPGTACRWPSGGRRSQHFAQTGWIRLHEDTLGRLRRRQAERGLPSFDAAVAELLRGGRMTLDELRLPRCSTRATRSTRTRRARRRTRRRRRSGSSTRRLRGGERGDLRPPPAASACSAARRSRRRRAEVRLPAGRPASGTRRSSGAPAPGAFDLDGLRAR